MNHSREQEVLTMIGEALRSTGGLLAGRRVVLFGSRACGKARERSDLDSGVDGVLPLPFADYYAIEDKSDALRVYGRLSAFVPPLTRLLASLRAN